MKNFSLQLLICSLILVNLLFVSCKGNSIFKMNNDNKDNGVNKAIHGLFFHKFNTKNEMKTVGSSHSPVHLKGWLKFIPIREDDLSNQDCFKKNFMYYSQKQDRIPDCGKYLESDQFGCLNIPGEDYFFFELSNDELRVATSRSEKYRKVVDSVRLGEIVNEGVAELGAFSEGYCFLIKFIKLSVHTIWELCAEKEDFKNLWMNTLSSLVASQNKDLLFLQDKSMIKGRHSKKLGSKTNLQIKSHKIKRVISTANQSQNLHFSASIVATAEIPGYSPTEWSPCSKPCGAGIQSRFLKCNNIELCGNEKELKQNRYCNLTPCKEDVESSLAKLQKVATGKWELLGNISKCSKPCGGGTRTIRRICIGENCLGSDIVSEPCNTFQCKKKKLFPTNCASLHGEFELLLKEAAEDFKTIPISMNMNMKNIEIFDLKDSKHEKPLYAFAFSQLSKITKSGKFPRCMKLTAESTPNLRLCTKQENLCQKWLRKINQFKQKCIHANLEKPCNSTMLDPVQQIKNANQQMKMKTHRHNEMKKYKMQRQFEEFQKQSKSLLAKEEQYEKELMEKEKVRIKEEENKLTEEIRKEKLIANQMIRDLQDTLNEQSAVKMRENLYQRQMNNIMQKIHTSIANQRVSLATQLEQERRAQLIRRAHAMKEMLNARRGQNSSVWKKGIDPNQCYLKKEDLRFVKNYCVINFKEFGMREECVKRENFCYMCCKKELLLSKEGDVNCCQKKCETPYFQCRIESSAMESLANKELEYGMI